MSTSKECCFIGRGEAFVSEAEGTCGWNTLYDIDWGGTDQGASYIGRSLGNVSALSIRPSFSTIQNVKRSGLISGPDCAAITVDGFEVEMTFSCLSRENMNQFLYGTISPKTCPTGPFQECIAAPPEEGFVCDGMITLKSPNFDPATLIITRLDTNQVLVENVDYVVENFGIRLKQTFLNSDLVLQIDYELTSDSYDCIEAFTSCPSAKRITFSGFNLADKDECFFIELYKIKFTPLSSLDLITDDFLEVTLTGQLEPNEDIVDPNQSQYFRICYKNKGA